MMKKLAICIQGITGMPSSRLQQNLPGPKSPFNTSWPTWPEDWRLEMTTTQGHSRDAFLERFVDKLSAKLDTLFDKLFGRN